MQTNDSSLWRKCSSCKKPIGLGARYYVCSVSTCNGQRTGYVFCSVPCFEIHLPGARHKDAAAVEQTAPIAASASTEPKRTIIASAKTGSSLVVTASTRTQTANEVLIIASRLKDYIQSRAEMNTSGQVVDVLSDYVRVLCDRAIDNARSDGRKTVMDRDFHFLKN